MFMLACCVFVLLNYLTMHDEKEAQVQNDTGTSSFGTPPVDPRQWDWENWQFQANLFWATIVYSCLSFPFLVFSVPLLSQALTHAKPTGFSPNGVCIRKFLSEEYRVPIKGKDKIKSNSKSKSKSNSKSKSKSNSKSKSTTTDTLTTAKVGKASKADGIEALEVGGGQEDGSLNELPGVFFGDCMFKG